MWQNLTGENNLKWAVHSGLEMMCRFQVKLQPPSKQECSVYTCSQRYTGYAPSHTHACWRPQEHSYVPSAWRPGRQNCADSPSPDREATGGEGQPWPQTCALAQACDLLSPQGLFFIFSLLSRDLPLAGAPTVTPAPHLGTWDSCGHKVLFTRMTFSWTHPFFILIHLKRCLFLM